ncbi:MAG TPA: stage III sporulation protein AE [Firmicutes bacterium]|nr:stage III sporulation protein AE [Bacillota bacterium]
MRRILAGLCLVCLLGFAWPVQAAETGETGETFDQSLYEEQMEESGAQDLWDSLPEETQELLEELGVEGVGWESLATVEPQSFFEMLLGFFTGGLSQPLAAGASLLGIMLVCALTNGMKLSFGERQTGSVLGMVGTLCACAVIAPPVISCIQQASTLIEGAGGFLLAGAPVLAGLMLACGQPVSASGWTVFLLAAGNGISLLSSVVLLPVMHIFLAFSLVSAVSPDIRLDSLCGVFAKTVRWVLVLAVTIFTSLLSAQSLISASADGASVKAAKLFAGFVPVVGNVLGDAMGTVQSCVRLLKSGVGAFGLLAALCIFLPVVAQCLLWIFCCTLCGAAGDLLGQSEITGLLKAASQVLQTLLAIVVSCAVVMLVSAVLIMQGGGSG